jgi:pimeloyl-ACP methyl ester carboxylesterase
MDAMYASMVPSLADDEGFRRWFKTYFRLAASPAAALELDRAAMETDIREILPAIRMPTLVLYLASHRPPARDVAARIPNATAVELPGVDHWLADSDLFLGEIEEFLTGMRRAPDVQRVLATVVFTDIVGSTERAADLGDRAWRPARDAPHARAP